MLAEPYACSLHAALRARMQPDENAFVLGCGSIGLLLIADRAFDLREEDRIYDTLERSVSGDLLADVYLETRRSLELENQGGARAKVKDVEMFQVQPGALRREDDGDLTFDVRGSWIVTGSVGHWGHIHQRRNQYAARLTIRSVDGNWKITALELLEELRITTP